MTTQHLIPKRFIQIGKAVQPLAVRGMMANLRLLNPDFEYLFYDDASAIEKFVSREFPQYQAVFNAFSLHIQRIDFFRYLAIYRLGGFYFDLDILMSSGISELCEYSSVFPFERITFSPFLRRLQMDWEIGNFGFGAAAGHPFLGAVIENCIRAQKDRAWVNQMLRGTPLLSRPQFYVLYSTGPGLISRTLAENPELARSVKVLFPDDVFDSAKWNCFGDYGVHLMTGTWRPKMGAPYRRIVRELENWKMRKQMRQSAALGKTRSHVYTARMDAEEISSINSEQLDPLHNVEAELNHRTNYV